MEQNELTKNGNEALLQSSVCLSPQMVEQLH